MQRLTALAAAAVLLAAPAVLAKGPAEDQESYPTARVARDLDLAANETADVAVTPKLTVSFTAGPAGARLNVSIDVKWRAEALRQPVAAAPGSVLSYIQVDGEGLADVARVRFDCVVDEGFAHDLLYWDGAGWSALLGRAGQVVEGRAGGRPLAVQATDEAGGHVVVEVDHASAFALTSTPPPSADDAGPPIPGVGPSALLLALAAASVLVRRR